MSVQGKKAVEIKQHPQQTEFYWISQVGAEGFNQICLRVEEMRELKEALENFLKENDQ